MKQVTVQCIFFGASEHPVQGGHLVAGFEARFSLDQLEYHVGGGTYYRMGLIGKMVDVRVTLEMVREA